MASNNKKVAIARTARSDQRSGLRPSGRRCCIIDVETAPDRFAQLLSGRRGKPPCGSPLLEVITASMLEFSIDDAGECGAFALRSFHRNEYRETDILLNLESRLSAIADDGGILATFNGGGFDLPLLRLRQARWWLCDADAVRRIADGSGEHIDVMRELSMGGVGRWPTLEDACASMGFSLRGPTVAGRETMTPRQVERCEIDVVGTMILLFHILAVRRRSAASLRQGLPALGRFLRKEIAGRPHLERFAASGMLQDDATAWGAD